MELSGRLTADAAIRRTKDERELVAFTVVDNHRYKTKAGEQKNDATFFKCSYWVSTAIARHLTKGTIVTVFGRVGIDSYKKRDGDFVANLTFHANSIKILGGAKNQSTNGETPNSTEQAKEDLPF